MSVADLRKHIAAATDYGRFTFITSRGRRVAVIGPLSLVPSVPTSLADEFDKLTR